MEAALDSIDTLDLEATLNSTNSLGALDTLEVKADERLFFELERELEPYSAFYHQMTIPEWDEDEEPRAAPEVPARWSPSEGYAALLERVRQLY